MFDLLLPVDKHDTTPRHAQVQRVLCDLVRTGKLKPGDKIPAELQIADAMGVSKMTINKAILALTAGGLFVREVGRGTFVAPNAMAAAAGIENPAADSHVRGATQFVVGGAGRTKPSPRQRLRITLSFPFHARNVLDSDYYSRLYHGVIDAVGDQTSRGGEPDVDMALVPLTARDYQEEDERSPADGRIIIAPRADVTESIETLWDAGRALVVLGASWPSIGVPAIDSDNARGAMDAVRHLIALGHRRIAFLYAEADTANIQDRQNGYRRALRMAEQEHDPAWEILAEKAWEIGLPARQQLRTLLSGPERVTAVFAAGHYLAMLALNEVREVGLRVPEEVSVVGFDDPLSAQLVFPQLSSVRQPLYEMGRRAGERVLRLLRGEEARTPIREVLPTRLIVRQSTAPVSRL